VKTPGIIFPDQPEKPAKYIRKPIDYTILDGVGAGGVKTHMGTAQRSQRADSVSSHNSSSHGNVPPHHVNNSNPPSAAGTLSRVNRIYGPGLGRQNSGHIATPVVTPNVPSHYMSARELQTAQQTGQPANLANPIYGTNMSVAPPPPPMPSQNGSRDSSGYLPTAQFNGELPPPAPLSPPLPPMPDETDYNSQDMPPPPPDDMPSPPGSRPDSSMPPPHSSFPEYGYDRNSYDDGQSVPLPPSLGIPQAPDVNGSVHPPWAPESFIEKVIAIYEYEPQNDDELRFRENTVLYVIKKNSDGWWEGVMEAEGGHPVCGLFPENYVESLL